MDNMKHRRLQEMDRSDFGVVEGEPDIRGWDVRLSSGEKAGEVEDLIVDAQERRVRYMVVDLDDSELDLEDRKVLIPIGLAQLDKDDDDVVIHGVGLEQLTSLPQYDADRLNDEEEKKISAILGREPTKTGSVSATAPDPDREFYRHEHFDDNNLYKNRATEGRMAPVANDRQERQSDEEAERGQGLRIWRLRSDDATTGDSDRSVDNNVDDEKRIEMVRNRRQSYENRRGTQDPDRSANRRDYGRNDERDGLL